jgi:hypothetical protein
VILVHHDRNARVALDGGVDEMPQEHFAGVLSRAGRGLHDHGAVGFRRGCHDGLHLLEVVHVEGRQAVAVLGRMVEQLAHRNEGHRVLRWTTGPTSGVKTGSDPKRA